MYWHPIYRDWWTSVRASYLVEKRRCDGDRVAYPFNLIHYFYFVIHSGLDFLKGLFFFNVSDIKR